MEMFRECSTLWLKYDDKSPKSLDRRHGVRADRLAAAVAADPGRSRESPSASEGRQFTSRVSRAALERDEGRSIDDRAATRAAVLAEAARKHDAAEALQEIAEQESG